MQGKTTGCVGGETAQLEYRALAVQGAKDKLAARLYATKRPAGDAAPGLIVFFPSGGFVTDELDAGDEFFRALAVSTGWNVLGSSYTLATVRPFPAAAEDAHAVLNWVARNKAKVGWDGKRLVTAGIEAGGNLAAVSALMARDRGGPTLTAQLLLMPMLDPGLTSCSMRRLSRDAGVARATDQCAAAYRDYLPRAIDRAHPYASPLQSSRMKGLPPALILSADDDPLRDEAEQYGIKLNSAGIMAVVKRLPHIELQEPNARCSCARRENALREIAAFLERLYKETPS
ncbi:MULTISPECIES: alpha/beta hydrolase [Oxalobacteraceae]|jgi:acetyl esterase/lipase|uniref:alpha/beta hydrolase n=1 Tax=Oxalobacteraceae TaxID=75682 RepID=UPI0010A4001A|nr:MULTISPECIES: alpha/beta hydrolase [Oxalobacteraceae]